MNIKQLFADDDAVSPVIGVILMVAITVILAAVIGAFVLGFGGGGPSAPTTTWDSTEETNTSGNVENVTFEVTSTDQFSADTLEVQVGDQSYSVNDEDAQVTAGSEILVQLNASSGNSHSLSSGDDIELVWSEEGSSSTVATHTLSADPAGTESDAIMSI